MQRTFTPLANSPLSTEIASFGFIAPPQIFLVILFKPVFESARFGTFQPGLSTTPTDSGHDSTSNLRFSCLLQIEMGMPKATSCSRYDGQYVSPLIPRQQTSHVQQDHPHSGGVLNSFVLPARRWVPLLLAYRVMPSGETQSRLTGSAFVVDLHSRNPAPMNGGRFPRCSFESPFPSPPKRQPGNMAAIIAYAACCSCGRTISVRSLCAS